ncbi:hypothetical protein CHS0354_036284 [Potamilus streckersoni]|nr:hypothetical protein CHS0354_036284 [Potamilus streckersoni]
MQRSRRQSVNETLSQNETTTRYPTTNNQMVTKITWTTPVTPYPMSPENSSGYKKSENSTQEAIVHSESTSIANTQHSTLAMSNSSTQNTSADTKVTTSISTTSEAPGKMTDSTFKHHVTSVKTLVTGVKHTAGQTPATNLSMATQRTSTLGQDVKGETDFGRYGLLAFGITLAVVLSLVFALIFVLTRRRKKGRPVDIQDEDRSPRLRMLEVPGLGESKDDGLQTYSLGYDNGNNRISVRPPGGIQTPFAGVSTFMLSKRGSNSSNCSSGGYVSPRNSAMSPLKESPYEFQPLVSDTPSHN